MAGDLKVLVEDLAKVRGQIGVAKMRLLKAKEKERELLLEILGVATAEDAEMESLWDRMAGNFELALMIGPDVAVVKIDEEYFEWPQNDRHKAVNVAFIPLAQSAPLNESAPDAANIQGFN